MIPNPCAVVRKLLGKKRMYFSLLLLLLCVWWWRRGRKNLYKLHTVLTPPGEMASGYILPTLAKTLCFQIKKKKEKDYYLRLIPNSYFYS